MASGRCARGTVRGLELANGFGGIGKPRAVLSIIIQLRRCCAVESVDAYWKSLMSTTSRLELPREMARRLPSRDSEK